MPLELAIPKAFPGVPFEVKAAPADAVPPYVTKASVLVGVHVMFVARDGDKAE